MKELHMTITFSMSGYTEQEIVIHDSDYTADAVMKGLQEGTFVTTTQEGGEVYDCSGGTLKRIGEVISNSPESEYVDFDLLDCYTTEVIVSNDKQKPFDMTDFALAGAIGEFIFEPEKSTSEIMDILEKAGGEEPPLNVEEIYSGLSGRQLLKEIDLMQRGLKNMMNVAAQAARDGREII